MFDIYMHDVYFVVAPRHVSIGLAALWGMFAVLYFFGDRALAHGLNKGLSMAHFMLWNFSFLALFSGSWGLDQTIQSHHDPTQSWLFVAGFVAPVLAFILGGILFVANLVFAIILKLKTA